MTDSPVLQQIDRTCVLHRGRRFSYFSGCDYYRLSSHPRVLRALGSGLKRFGLNVAASRLTTGHHRLYEQLENCLARFFDAESATLFSSGYAANLALGQTLAGRFSHALIDERAHPSLADAAVFLRCPVLRFQHCSPKDLAGILGRIRSRRRVLVLTDGLFSHDGSIALLKEYLDVLPDGCVIFVDDAHSAGVLGEKGRGTPEFCGVSRERLIQSVTLSKAFGVYGGAILGSEKLRRDIREDCHLFVGNTPLPLPLAAAALEAIRILQKDGRLRRRLAANTLYVKQRLRQAGYPILENPSPIVSVVPRDRREIAALTERLSAARIYPPFIQYPGGPAMGYFRIALSTEHTRDQLEELVNALARHRQSLSC